MSVPLLFLHGWAMRGAVFDDIAARLRPDFVCHAPDLPGHGSRAGDAPSLERCVAVAREAIGQLDRPIVIGWSMGATVAWRYIAQHGTANLRGLVTIDMSPRVLPDHDWHFGLRGQSTEQILATSAKIEAQWQGMVRNILRNMYARGHEPVGDADVIENWLQRQSPKTLRPLWDALVAQDARDVVAKVDIPYLVCAGLQSRLYDPEVARWIAENSPDATVEYFQTSGHSPHLEEPAAFCDAIRRFVAADVGATQKRGACAGQ